MLGYFFCIFLLIHSTVNALTLDQALSVGYLNNDAIKQNQNDFFNASEEYQRALSGFFPRIYGQYSSNITKHEVGYIRKNENISLIIENNLFSGGANVASLAAARNISKGAIERYYAIEQDIFLKQINIYLSTIEAQEKYRISKTSLLLNKTQLDAVKEKFLLGESTETELAMAREAFATAQANQAMASAKYESSKAQFSEAFSVVPQKLSIPKINMEDIDIEKFVDNVLLKNHLINSVRYEVKSAKIGELIAKSVLMPKANLQTVIKDDKFDLGSGTALSAATSLQVIVPILANRGLEHSDIRRSKLNYKKSIINLDKTSKQLVTESRSAIFEINGIKLRIEATEKAISAAKTAYDSVVQEEGLGYKTVLDILKVEERLHNAEIAYIDAKKAYVLGYFKIKSLLGELTANDLSLDVDYFDPGKKSVKRNIN